MHRTTVVEVGADIAVGGERRQLAGSRAIERPCLNRIAISYGIHMLERGHGLECKVLKF